MASSRRTPVPLLLMQLLVYLHNMDASDPTIPKEYCLYESFNTSCPSDNQVVIMTLAKYGRELRNRCVTFESRCHADVLEEMDARCSGTSICSVRVPDDQFQQMMPCPIDTIGYLEAAYRCVEVVKVPTEVCSFIPIEVESTTSGYLASPQSHQRSTKIQPCHYRITMAKGQRINITLLDFGLSLRREEASTTCYVYGVVQEQGGANGKDINVCGRGQRETSEYISDSNQVEIELRAPSSNTDPMRFLIRFEAVGCADPVTPPGAWVHRNGDKATVGCNFTEQIWHIVCTEKSWQKIDNCTAHHPTNPDNHSKPDENFPFGLLVAVITGIILGVLIGVAMLALVFCLQRRRKNRREEMHTSQARNLDPDSPFLQKTPAPCDPGYGYTHVWPTLRGHPATHPHLSHEELSPATKDLLAREGTLKKIAHSCRDQLDANKIQKTSDRGGMVSVQVRMAGNSEGGIMNPGTKIPMYEDYQQGGQDMRAYDVTEPQPCVHHHHHLRPLHQGDISQPTPAS